MQVLIDYLTLTSKIHDIHYFIEALGLAGCDFFEMPGRYGWSVRIYFRGVSLLYGGSRDDICLEISGTGCRTVEEVSENTFDWFGFLSGISVDVRNRDVNIARLDIAGDDHDGLLDYRRMTVHCKHRRYICKAHWCMWTDGDEQAIYFGSPKSDRRLRIYNKALEQGLDDHWIRAEFQLRNDNAVSFLLNWVKSGDVGRCYSGVLRDFLRFTKTTPGNHSERCEVCAWWQRFIGAAANCRQIYLQGGTYTMLDVEHFIKRQAASSLKLWLEAHNGDFSDILDMCEKSQLNFRQAQLLAKIRGGEEASKI